LIFVLGFLLFLGCFEISAQQQLNLFQDPKFEELLNSKRKINSAVALNDSYKIQIYSGVHENAKIKLNQFKQDFKNLECAVIFRTPNYKVWVGSFKTRIDAERNLILIKKKYSNALLIKPNK
jgi:hypothetical protein